MKILLVGNYVADEQQSMSRYEDMLYRNLRARKYDVRLVRPGSVLGRLCGGNSLLNKWLAYIDKFLLFPFRLRFCAERADIVHVCDHSNAMYMGFIGKAPGVITCHDMLAIRAARNEFAERKVHFMGRILQRVILQGIKKAKIVVCVSRGTKADLQRITLLSDEQVFVVPNALNRPYAPMAKSSMENHLKALGVSLDLPFILHVGGNQWYKNRIGVVRIFSEFAKRPGSQSYSLLMVGEPFTAQMRDLICASGLSSRVVELVSVSDDALCALYSSAAALLFPSLYEGFGWPIIEAMACGCPVVTSDRPPMTDVGGRAASYIDPNDSVAASAVFESVLSCRSEWVALGLERAEHFSKENMLDGYVQCYMRANRRGFSSNIHR